jgi:hypothetical protein
MIQGVDRGGPAAGPSAGMVDERSNAFDQLGDGFETRFDVDIGFGFGREDQRAFGEATKILSTVLSTVRSVILSAMGECVEAIRDRLLHHDSLPNSRPNKNLGRRADAGF